MEALGFALAAIFLICLACAAIGFFSPETVIRWGKPENKTRNEVLRVYGIIGLAAFIIMGLMPAPPERTPVVASQKSAQKPVEQKQPDFSVSDLDVMWEGYFGYITGTVKNNTNHAYRYAEININVYDESGAQIATPMSNTENLQAGGTWKFKTPIIPRPTGPFTYKVVKIHGMK